MYLKKHVADASQLPVGYSMRPATLDDAEQLLELFRITAADQGEKFDMSPELIRSDWKQPGFSLEDSCRLIFSESGELVAQCTLWDVTKPPVTPYLSWALRPDHTESGLGEFMMSWGLETAQRCIELCPPDVRIAFQCGCKTGYTPKESILEASELTHIRYFYRMRIDMVQEPPTAQIPDGFHIRTYQHPEEFEKVARADQLGFKDHWGFYEPESFEDFVENWRHHITSDKIFDPTIWFLAIDDETDEIAGICLCRNEEWSNPEVAYVESLAIMPQYRKRGLALALLHHCFKEFWDRDRNSVTLHVDASSLTGATRLYERAGMRVDNQESLYELELRAGTDVTTQQVHS